MLRINSGLAELVGVGGRRARTPPAPAGLLQPAVVSPAAVRLCAFSQSRHLPRSAVERLTAREKLIVNFFLKLSDYLVD